MAFLLLYTLSLLIHTSTAISALSPVKTSDQLNPTQLFYMENAHIKHQTDFHIPEESMIPSFIDSYLSSHQCVYSFCLVLAGLMLIVSSSIGFYFGLLRPKAFSPVSRPTSPSSSAITIDSPTHSPISPCLSPCSFKSNPSGLIDNGSYKRNFVELALLRETISEKVFVAEHKLDKQKYLVKAMPVAVCDSIKEHQVYKEISKVKGIDCCHIARYVTSWVEEDEPAVDRFGRALVLLYVQMEFIEGLTMEQWLEDEFNEKKALAFVKQVAKALAYLESKVVPHGKLTLENIFINKYGAVALGDFEFGKCFCDDRKGFIRIISAMLPRFENKKKLGSLLKSLDYVKDAGLSDSINRMIAITN
jgi:hypothetical protein